MNVAVGVVSPEIFVHVEPTNCCQKNLRPLYIPAEAVYVSPAPGHNTTVPAGETATVGVPEHGGAATTFTL